jgi:hypothetical protein
MTRKIHEKVTDFIVFCFQSSLPDFATNFSSPVGGRPRVLPPFCSLSSVNAVQDVP